MYLTKPFSKGEIKVALWGLGVDKAPGPDGFPIFFYRDFRDIVKPEVIKSYERFTRRDSPATKIKVYTCCAHPKIRRGKGGGGLQNY